MTAVLALVAATIVCAEAAAWCAAPPQPSASVLPRLDLERLPSSVRASVTEVFDAARTNASSPAAIGRLAMMLHAYEQYRAAADCYALARRLGPASTVWAYLSGIVLAQLGDHDAAAAAFREVLRAEPENAAARLRLADALLEAGDLGGARQQYEDLTSAFPELALAHYGLGRIAAARGETATALQAFRRAVALAPAFGAAHYALALAARDAGDTVAANAHLADYRRHGASRPPVRDALVERVRAMRQTARDLLETGARLVNAGRIDEAIAAHLEAIALDSSSGQAHVNLIALYGRTAQFAEAESHYRAALASGNSVAEAHYNYGVLLASRGNAQEAMDVFRRALDADPFYPEAHYNLAALLARERSYDAAAAHYREALANDPRHSRARVNLARVLMLSGRRGEAGEVLRIALQRAQRDGDRALASEIQAELARLEKRR
jgi:tetratricopeptide (TPR) repeat protein